MEHLSKKELFVICEELGLTQYKSKNKGGLIEMIGKKNGSIVSSEPHHKHLKPLVKWSGGKGDEIRLFEKYFPEEYMSDPKNVLNSINYRNESRYINEIQEYEARIAQGKAFRLAIKEELIATVWHPDKVEKIINKYGIDYLDNL